MSPLVVWNDSGPLAQIRSFGRPLAQWRQLHLYLTTRPWSGPWGLTQIIYEASSAQHWVLSFRWKREQRWVCRYLRLVLATVRTCWYWLGVALQQLVWFMRRIVGKAIYWQFISIVRILASHNSPMLQPQFWRQETRQLLPEIQALGDDGVTLNFYPAFILVELSKQNRFHCNYDLGNCRAIFTRLVPDTEYVASSRFLAACRSWNQAIQNHPRSQLSTTFAFLAFSARNLWSEEFIQNWRDISHRTAGRWLGQALLFTPSMLSDALEGSFSTSFCWHNQSSEWA